MKKFLRNIRGTSLATASPYVDSIETLKDEMEGTIGTPEGEMSAPTHAEPGSFQAIKSAVKGHGEQTILPDDCGYCDNDLCYVEA
ncbi:MAG: hypothetical protein AAB227_05755 [Pseudomonadota bacterium]